MAKDNNTEIENEEGIVIKENAGSIEAFFEENQKIVFGALALVILVVAGFVGYNKLVVGPKEKQASEVVFHAQNWFADGKYQLALEGDDNNYGFYEIMDDFKGTKVGKTAKYYAGICELNLGNYDEAIAYLSKFKTIDKNVQAEAYERIGDAHAQLEELDAAAKQYIKAANTATLKAQIANNYYKAGMAFEADGNKAEAAAAYKNIVDEYPDVNDFTLGQALQSIAKKGHLNYHRTK